MGDLHIGHGRAWRIMARAQSKQEQACPHSRNTVSLLVRGRGASGFGGFEAYDQGMRGHTRETQSPCRYWGVEFFRVWGVLSSPTASHHPPHPAPPLHTIRALLSSPSTLPAHATPLLLLLPILPPNDPRPLLRVHFDVWSIPLARSIWNLPALGPPVQVISHPDQCCWLSSLNHSIHPAKTRENARGGSLYCPVSFCLVISRPVLSCLLLFCSTQRPHTASPILACHLIKSNQIIILRHAQG